ncbi:MAG: MFS transporter [Deltaproteobacteria bacterium]|nr:MFS transporter [Deltaproteobacteria bacterium]
MKPSPPSQRVAAQLPLGMASGLPLFLTGPTLTAWLESEAISIEAIGVFALVALPYNLKFLWAPLLDRFRLPWLGRRRGWMLLFQLLVCSSLVLLAAQQPQGSLLAIAVLALATAVLSASFDVAVDAYRTDVLEEDERGRGTSAYVIGYRLALIVAGSGALILADVVGWRSTYLIMAALVGLGAVASWWAPATEEIEAPRSLRESVVAPFSELLGRRAIVGLLAIVVLYRVGDSLVMHMIVPFLLEIDFSNTEIGVVQKGFGMAATILGVWLGGSLVDRLGPWKALLLFGLVQALANLGYIALAVGDRSLVMLAAAVVVDNVCNGLGTAAFVTFLTALCHHRFSATQYALLTSLSTVLGRLLAAGSGFVVAALGWAALFGGTVAAAIPALAVIYVLARKKIAVGQSARAV